MSDDGDRKKWLVRAFLDSAKEMQASLEEELGINSTVDKAFAEFGTAEYYFSVLQRSPSKNYEALCKAAETVWLMFLKEEGFDKGVQLREFNRDWDRVSCMIVLYEDGVIGDVDHEIMEAEHFKSCFTDDQYDFLKKLGKYSLNVETHKSMTESMDWPAPTEADEARSRARYERIIASLQERERQDPAFSKLMQSLPKGDNKPKDP